MPDGQSLVDKKLQARTIFFDSIPLPIWLPARSEGIQAGGDWRLNRDFRLEISDFG
jgi:hypothetical protein